MYQLYMHINALQSSEKLRVVLFSLAVCLPADGQTHICLTKDIHGSEPNP